MHSLASARAAWTAFALLAVAAPVALWAQSDGSERRRAVGDWMVEDVAEDTSRAVHIRREEGDYSIDYHLWLEPGSDRVSAHGFLIGRLNCARGGEESVAGSIDAAAVRRRIEEYLGGCDAPPQDVAALLQGYDRAFELAHQWADERAAEMANMDSTAAEMAADNAMMAASNVAETDANAAEATLSMDAGSADENATVTDTNTIADPQ